MEVRDLGTCPVCSKPVIDHCDQQDGRLYKVCGLWRCTCGVMGRIGREGYVKKGAL